MNAIDIFPQRLNFKFSHDEMKLVTLWLRSGSEIKITRKNLNCALLVRNITTAFVRFDDELRSIKPQYNVYLTMDEAFAIHNMIRSSPPGTELFEYATISNLYHTIESAIHNGLSSSLS
jgi:hypothetical protein